jgi:hypothetical protein
MKFWPILYSVENFKDYANQYLDCTPVFFFVKKYQKQRRVI